MRINLVSIFLLLSTGLISIPSVFAQSPKAELIEMMEEFVGMIEYDGKTFFVDRISSFGSTSIKLSSKEKYSSTQELIFDLSRINTNTLTTKRLTSRENGEFDRYEVRFEGKGSINEKSSYGERVEYSSISLCMAGKELLDPTAFDITIAKSLLEKVRKASIAAKAARKKPATKTYKIIDEQALVRQLLESKEVNFEANRQPGGYITIHGGMKEFVGDVNTMCIEMKTNITVSEIRPDISLPLVYILVRTFEGKRETVAEISGTFPKRENATTCCKDCLSFPERKTFPSGAYEVFIYIGEQQARKFGNFIFAVK